ncbi:glycosyl hydrolase [Maribacter sp. R77961]|uniref:glycosyl hydrolase n=1 Tax=Maribacter sp. R77961 TaxID=3093871 RepID=UPI0037C7B0D5
MRNLIIYWALALLLLFSCQSESKPSDLETGFQNPPNEAKARTWWHWLSGNVSKSGITKDLEAMKSVGIQEAQLFNVHLGFPQGPVKYLSEEWLNLFKFAAQEAKRLNLELAFHNGPGWSSSGGPWVTEAHAMQTVVFSELEVKGGQPINAVLPKPETKFEYYRDIAVLAFPKPKADIKIDNLDYKNLSERIRNHLVPDTKSISKDAVVSKDAIIDITSKLSEDGMLEWKAPQGEWIILRMGHTPIGTTNRPAPLEAKGLEVDKMSKTAVDAYWKGGVQPIIDTLGDLVGTTVNNCLIDSYEVETTNWTVGFDTEFEKLRGYDLTAYLPTLAGYYIDGGEISERFLWDFRRTIGDLIAENYYAHFRELCHENGMKLSVEPYWGPFDNMQVGAAGDIVMCEFWSGGYPFFDSPKFVSSIAHLNGSSIVGAESFTGVGGWNEHPAQLKSIGDRAWAEGITRFIFHTYVHQPWDVAPGLALSYHGTDFNRLNTWWQQSSVYMDYIARSQFLLQQGKSVADVLVFTGESSPNTAFLKPEIKNLGYDYDLIGANKLQELFVENGEIYTSKSGPYKVLQLTASEWMKPETIKKVNQLIADGAKVIGAKPKKSPSLENHSNADAEIQVLAKTLWDSEAVKDTSIENYLTQSEVPADFKVERGDGSDINFIHRKTEEADIYFIANARKESREITSRFRVSGKQPELWNAETGETKDLVVFTENTDGTTTVPISLGMEASVFVVFRNSITKPHLVETSIKVQRPDLEPLSNLEVIKAEYGTFLQEGLIDITDKVSVAVTNGKLDFKMTRAFCDCDPAMGYKKEFRMEYQLGEKIHQLVAEEREHIHFESGQEPLRILKAVFGKFKAETKGVPANYKIHDITAKIQDMVAAGNLDIPIQDELIGAKDLEGNKTALKITYNTDGEEYTRSIPEGGILKLSKDLPKPELLFKNGAIQWATPYPGVLTYATADGKSKAVEVKSTPEPIELYGAWEVEFPEKKATFDTLISWSTSTNDEIRHFSGTASYKKQFTVSKDVIGTENSLLLDLGSVHKIAEVFVNGQQVGVLWKPPFRLPIDNLVKAGQNTLEIKVTNLWPNRLIGDENLPLDYERKGDQIKEWPAWLTEGKDRPTERSTFTSWNHWKADDALLTSGLLGPVKIIVLELKNIDDE